MNQKPFKQLPGNRLEAFNMLDKPVLTPLPKHPYEYTDIKKVKVNIDYHIQYQKHHYSVPHQYVGESLELHASDTLVSLYFRHRQIASHPRSHQQGGMSTEAAHMPQSHQKHHQWTPERLKRWAADIGSDTLLWVKAQMDKKEHPEQAYRVCLGLLNLSREFTAQRLNAACGIANEQHLFKLKQVKSILKSNRDQLPKQMSMNVELSQDHDNVRGPKHFH